MISFFANKSLKTYILIIFAMTCIMFTLDNRNTFSSVYENFDNITNFDIHNRKVTEWLKIRNNEGKNLTKLGRILFLGDKIPHAKNRKYKILVWKYGKYIEKRLLKQYSNTSINPFKYCSVNNCDITYEDSDIKTADIVIFHLHRLQDFKKDIPKRYRRDQIWTFLTDESPYHTFLKRNIRITDFKGIFNWSMSYRMQSDIPVPYGRTILRKESLQPYLKTNKRRDVLIAIMGSNCGGKNRRWEYVKELQKHIKVDVYGKCGTLKCPGHFNQDCPKLDKYLFYLAFENSNCDEYITEKLWWNAFHKEAIPIVMGASLKTYKLLLPPNSYINVEDFARPASLAQYILHLNETNEYLNYFKWKTKFEILNEHGYFQSPAFHYCRVCEALNYNEKSEKVYNNFDPWIIKNNCHASWDIRYE